MVTDGDLGDGQNRTGNQVAEMAINRGSSPDHIAYFSDNPDGANEQLGMVAFDKSFIKGGLQQVLDWLAGNP